MSRLFSLPKPEIISKIGNPIPATSAANKRIKASFRCPLGYRREFPTAHCLLPISVGQLSHSVQSPQEGAKFGATIDLVNRGKFKKCTILVDDIIQVPTYSILHPNKSDKELLELTLAVGDRWISEHSQYHQKLDMPYEIKRWVDVVADSDFEQGRQKVREEYDKNPDYQQAFHQNIAEFLARLRTRGILFDQDHGFKKCLEYLINENAGMGFVWPKWGAQFEIYPSGRNASMAATYNRFIEPIHPDILKPIALRFVKRNLIEEAEEASSDEQVLAP